MLELAHPLDAVPQPSPLAAARERRDLTVKQVAYRSGLSEEEIEWLEDGRLYRFPSQSAAALAAVLYAIVDQNTSGIGQSANTNTFVPSPTGGANGGVGFASDANFKDLYGRFSYRFNLERDNASRNGVQAAGASGPRDHTYLNLGAFSFYGRSVQRFSGTDVAGGRNSARGFGFGRLRFRLG